MHLIALHEHGSSNPLGITGNIDRLPFSPYFVFKDLITVFVFLLVYSSFVFFSPNSLGQHWMALIKIIIFIPQCAICWKYLLIYNKTKIISDLYLNIKNNIYYKNNNINKLNILYLLLILINTNILLFKYYANPNLVKYYYKKYNQPITKIINLLLVGISETIRTQKIYIWLIINNSKLLNIFNNNINNINNNDINNEKYKIISKENNNENKNDNDDNKDKKFNEWLAGLIDGDGCFGVTQKKYTNCEITVGLEDEKMLRQIQHKYGGSIKLRSGVKAIRYRLQNRDGMIKLINNINGNIRHSKRLLQLHKICTILDIEIKKPIPLTINNAWFTGFFDADGTINYNYRDKDNKLKIRPQLTISVTNKYLQDVEPYLEIFGGNIYYDKSQNGYYKWSINNEELHMKYYNYNKINPSKSFKGNRIFLIKEYYKLYNLKAFRSEINTLLLKSWLIFDKKWHKFKY